MRVPRRACAALCLLVLSACGSADAPPDVAPDTVDLPTVDLPTVGLLGALPPRKGRVDIVLDRDGVLSVNGRPCTLKALRSRLIEASGGSPPKADLGKAVACVKEVLEETKGEVQEVSEGDLTTPAQPAAGPPTFESPPARLPGVYEPDGSRAADLLLRVDRRVPWTLVLRLLRAAAHSEVMLYRIWWAVRGEDGLGEGAVAQFLEKDHLGGCSPLPSQLPADVRIRVWTQAGRHDPGEVYRILRSLRTSWDGPVLAILAAHPLTPWALVVRHGNAALQAGIHAFGLEGHTTRAHELTITQWMQAAARAPSFQYTVTSSVELDGRAVRPPPRQRMEGTVGMPMPDFSISVELEEEEEEETEEEAAADKREWEELDRILEGR